MNSTNIVPFIHEDDIRQIWNTNMKGVPVGEKLFDMLTPKQGGPFRIIEAEGNCGKRKILIRTSELETLRYTGLDLIGEYDLSDELMDFIRSNFDITTETGICSAVTFYTDKPMFAQAPY